MPLYEFRCKACAHQFEVLQKVEDPPPPCPNPTFEDDSPQVRPCGGETSKLISISSFLLKGGGWASEGYGK